MKILVCAKQVPDTMEVKLGDDFTLQRDFVAQVLNPADESALELALALRDLHGGSVTALTMGPPRVETMLREILSRGADHAVQLTDSSFAGADTLATARTLHAAVGMLGGFDLILCGRRAADGETGQVGPMLASLLDIACVPNVTHVHIDGNKAFISQLTEYGTQNWQCTLPAVVTMCEWSYRLRLPSLHGLKTARMSKIPCYTPSHLGLDSKVCGLKGSPTRVVRVNARPIGARPCRKLTTVELLEIIG